MKPNLNREIAEKAKEEQVSLDVLRRDLIAYIDLHGVFHPESDEPPQALLTITRELQERLSGIVLLAANQASQSVADVVKKLEIYSYTYDNADAALPKVETNKLLHSAIQDLKAIG